MIPSIPIITFKGCPHRASSVSGRGSFKMSVRLDLIGIHCDAPLMLENCPPPIFKHHSAFQIPMRSNLTLILTMPLQPTLDVRCVHTLTIIYSGFFCQISNLDTYANKYINYQIPNYIENEAAEKLLSSFNIPHLI